MLEILNNKPHKEQMIYMENLIKEYSYKCKMILKEIERKSYQVAMINEKWKYIHGEIGMNNIKGE
jgi:hypothetical protein